jgi:hypothetical protein
MFSPSGDGFVLGSRDWSIQECMVTITKWNPRNDARVAPPTMSVTRHVEMQSQKGRSSCDGASSINMRHLSRRIIEKSSSSRSAQLQSIAHFSTIHSSQSLPLLSFKKPPLSTNKMKTFTTVALIMTAIAGVSALPTAPEVRTTYDPCDGITQQPQCCATDVLGLVNLNCGNRKCL